MAATEILPSNIPDLTTGELLFPSFTGLIPKIMESVATQSVAINTVNSDIQESLASNEIELGVAAPNRKSIEGVLGRLIGGCGFLYELEMSRGRKGFYTLRVISFISPLQVMTFAKALQAISDRITVYVEGNLVPVV